jgi:hypothetical protein
MVLTLGIASEESGGPSQQRWLLFSLHLSHSCYFPPSISNFKPSDDRLKGVEQVRMMEQGVLGSFIGMLALVLYNFGKVSLVDIPEILMAAAAFIAIYKKISLPYILLAGGIFSIIFWGLLN